MAQALCRQGEIRLWDVGRRRLLGPPLTVDGGAVYSVAFSPDGETMAAGAFDGSLLLWDVKRLRLAGAPIRDRRYRCFNPVFSPDGATLACGDVGKIVFWNIRTRRIEGPPLLV
jgi:WD40 repeat protein